MSAALAPATAFGGPPEIHLFSQPEDERVALASSEPITISSLDLHSFRKGTRVRIEGLFSELNGDFSSMHKANSCNPNKMPLTENADTVTINGFYATPESDERHRNEMNCVNPDFSTRSQLTVRAGEILEVIDRVPIEEIQHGVRDRSASYMYLRRVNEETDEPAGGTIRMTVASDQQIEDHLNAVHKHAQSGEWDHSKLFRDSNGHTIAVSRVIGLRSSQPHFESKETNVATATIIPASRIHQNSSVRASGVRSMGIVQ